MSQKGLWTYENGLLLLLAVSFGFAFFDRNAINYLSDYIVRDLGINNTQLGMLGSALSLSWAVSALIIGRWSDATGVRKPFLIGILLAFSGCSILSGLATNFYMLLASRLIMGIAEGPLMPICLAILTVESSPSRRGLNVGFVQSVFASLLGAAIAPILLVKLAEMFNWRIAFFISGIPGIICALLVMRFIREPKATPAGVQGAESGSDGLSLLLRQRNIWLCAGLACLMVSWLMLHQNFLPRFLVVIRQLSNPQMSHIMSATGFCAAIVGFACPWLSDRIGRKPVITGALLLSLITPLACLYFPGSLLAADRRLALGALMFIGWIGTGSYALFMAVVPGETLSARYAATASGLVVCIGEIIGGFFAPLIGGWAADLTTLNAPIKMAVACAMGGIIISLFLKETAPVKTGRTNAQRETAGIAA
jgi:MFS family permease